MTATLKGHEMRLALFCLFVSLLGVLVSAECCAETFGTDISKAFAAAKKTGRPLVISFYGIWCPPCNELEESVFESPDFHVKAKHFDFSKRRRMTPTSWKLKDRYKVGGYPTVVFTNPSGDEIYRIVGYRSPKEFARAIDLVLSAKNQDLKKVLESSTVDSLWRCALVCTERKDRTCAETAYKKLENKLKPESAKYQLARGYFVENAPNEELKRDGYERLLTQFAESPQALVWAGDYLGGFSAETNATPKKALVEKVLSHFSKMLVDPRREELGISATDLLQMKADLLDKLGKSDEAKAAWKEAAAGLEKAAAEISSGSPERGFTIERISSLESAGDTDAALKLANEYRQKFPGEFTFHYKAASILERVKKYNEAIPIARRAYELSYGDNRIRVAILLINLLATVPDRASAQKAYEEVTREYKPDASLDVRTHRYLKQLDEAWKKFPSA